jgi:hypothetical protein
VGELGIHGNADYLRIAVLELFKPLVECQDLGGADKSEVQRVEEKNNIFASQAGELERGEGIVRKNCICGKIRVIISFWCEIELNDRTITRKISFVNKIKVVF